MSLRVRYEEKIRVRCSVKATFVSMRAKVRTTQVIAMDRIRVKKRTE